jgi:ABC-type glycerol-3-phosphate transport system substrate-binding protein
MRFGHMLASVALGFATLASTSAKAVEIEYWQYVFDTSVKAMTQLIAKFQEANPDIKVKQTTFPMPTTRQRSPPRFWQDKDLTWCGCSTAGPTISSPAR